MSKPCQKWSTLCQKLSKHIHFLQEICKNVQKFGAGRINHEAHEGLEGVKAEITQRGFGPKAKTKH